MARRTIGSIHKRTNPKTGAITYVASLEIGRTPTGSRIRPTKSATTKTEAQKLLKEMVAKHQAGLLTVKKNDTVESLGLYWVREIKSNQVRRSTATDYESRLRREVFPYLGQKRVQDLTGRDIERWMSILHNQGRSASTVNGARRILFQLCKYATRQELMLINPVTKTDPLKQDPNKTQVKLHWNLEEATKALKLAEGTPLDLFVHLALFTGMRRGEILGLQHQDVDLNEGTIFVQRTLKEQRVLNPEGVGTTMLVTDDPKTLSGFRRLAIPAQLVSALMRHQEAQSKLREAAAEKWIETSYLITSSVGTPMNPSNLNHRFTAFLKQNNLRKIRVHDLRHTAAHLSLEGNVRLEAVSQALGHSRIEVTKNIYARQVPKLVLEFSAGLAEHLQPIDKAIRDLSSEDFNPNVIANQ